MLAASPPEGCSTNNNGAPAFKVLGTYSMKVRSRAPTVPTWRVASPIGSAATAVATSANPAPIVQRGSVVSAMISRLRITRVYHTPPSEMRAIGMPHSHARGARLGGPAVVDRTSHDTSSTRADDRQDVGAERLGGFRLRTIWYVVSACRIHGVKQCCYPRHSLDGVVGHPNRHTTPLR